MAKELMKGNVAIAEAALRAGLQAYFGYPITPQTELLEHLALRMPDLGRVFLQAESEIAAINMVYGAAAAGARAMTSSSGPGISLMQEGLSYIAGSEVAAVIVNVMRGGPGLGNIQPAQSDYNQMTKSAGHGDFRSIVLAPSTVQEAINLTGLAFELAEKYRTIAFLAADGMLGQMMEPAELPSMQEPPATRPAWALTGAQGRPKNVITSVYLGGETLKEHNERLQAKLRRITAAEIRFETLLTHDADILIVAFGTVGRIAKTAIREARKQGIRVGLLRPITLWPFPAPTLEGLSKQVAAILVVEMNVGQMVDDVRLAVRQETPVHFYGYAGGAVPLPDEIVDQVVALQQRYARQIAAHNGRDKLPQLAVPR
ncbi:MAG: 3-methyl-2-oxobutanoate dehydrogenase subunit VorB [Chloroflexota bacterium]